MSTNRVFAASLIVGLLLAIPAGAQRRRGGADRGPLTPEIAQTAVATFEGVLRNFDKKKFVLDMDDGQTLILRRTKATKLKPAGDEKVMRLGIRVQVEARKDATGDLDAVRVCEGTCGAK